MKSARGRKKSAKGKKPVRAKAKSAKPGGAKKAAVRKQSTRAKAARARTQRRPGVYPDLRLGQEQVSSNECYDPEEK